PGSTLDTVTPDFGGPIQDLYALVFWWTVVILVVVYGVLAYVLWRFRERPGGPAPKKTRGNLWLEVGWTLAPAIIVVLIAIPTIRAVFRTQEPAPEGALTIDVVGHQWWWEFRYPEAGVVTANELHLPVGRTVELRLSSADVIHSFWVPRLGGKRDVNPRVRKPEGEPPNFTYLKFTVAEPGEYLGQCAEFCGTSHALMRMRVVAESPQEFDAWLERMKAPPDEPEPGTLAAEGRRIFHQSACIACHAIAGTTAQGVLGPSLTRVGARSTIGAGILENTPENLAAWIRAPITIKPDVRMPGTHAAGGGMPATGLTDGQAAAVAAYLASLR
ncbi:MAG: cytochrome c oxidase subunit II, partial [Gemmatimonadota bacterium]